MIADPNIENRIIPSSNLISYQLLNLTKKRNKEKYFTEIKNTRIQCVSFYVLHTCTNVHQPKISNKKFFKNGTVPLRNISQKQNIFQAFLIDE